MLGGVHNGEERTKKKIRPLYFTKKNDVKCFSHIIGVGTVSFNSRAATAAGVFLSLCVVFDTRSCQHAKTHSTSALVCLLCVRVRTFCSSTKQAHIFLSSSEFGQWKENSFLVGIRRGRGCLTGSGSDKCCLCGCKNKKNGVRKKIPEPDPLPKSETADNSKKQQWLPHTDKELL